MNNLSNNNYCMGHDPYKTTLHSIGGDLHYQIDQDVHWQTQDALHLQADEDIIFNAEDTLTLQCGNSTMTLEGGVITYTSPDFGIGENPAAGPNTTFAENRPILPGGVLSPKNPPTSGVSAQAFADAEQTHASMVRLCSKAQAQAIPTVAEKEENHMLHIFSNAEGSELTPERIAQAAAMKKVCTSCGKTNQCGMNIHYDFIAKKEGGMMLKGYVPAPKTSRSGVTISTEVDLGARDINELKVLGLDATLIAKLSSYLGLKRNDAVRYLKSHPLHITQKEALALYNGIRQKETQRLIAAYNEASKKINKVLFTCLPWQAQTVIASVAYQHGYAGLLRMDFWDQVTQQQWQPAYDNLMDFHDGFTTRRHSEAKLIKELL